MFKDRLREARLARNFTQAQLAAIINVVPSTIASYETGRSDPDMKRLVMLVGALHVDLDFLLQDEMRIMNNRNRMASCKALLIANKFDSLDDISQRVVETVVDLESKRPASHLEAARKAMGKELHSQEEAETVLTHSQSAEG